MPLQTIAPRRGLTDLYNELANSSYFDGKKPQFNLVKKFGFYQIFMRQTFAPQKLGKADVLKMRELGASKKKEDNSSLKLVRKGFDSWPIYEYRIMRDYYGLDTVVFTDKCAGLPSMDFYANLLRGVKTKFKEMRSRERELNFSSKTVHGMHYDLVGGVFENKGSILALLKNKRYTDFGRDKKPKTFNRHVGIEIEFCSSTNKDKLADALLEQDILKYCTWHDDQSLRPQPGEIRHELCLLVLETEVALVLRKLQLVFDKIEAKTEDRRCGLHVHFDMRKRDKDLVYNNLVACQKWLFKMVAPERRNGEFSQRVGSRRFPTYFRGDREERYKSINAAAFYRHKTLEIRVHEGTTDMGEVINWIKFLLKIVNYRPKLGKAISSLRGLTRTFKLNKSLDSYVKDRINYWRVNSGSGGVMARPTSGVLNMTRLNSVYNEVYGQSPPSVGVPIDPRD